MFVYCYTVVVGLHIGIRTREFVSNIYVCIYIVCRTGAELIFTRLTIDINHLYCYTLCRFHGSNNSVDRVNQQLHRFHDARKKLTNLNFLKKKHTCKFLYAFKEFFFVQVCHKTCYKKNHYNKKGFLIYLFVESA